MSKNTDLTKGGILQKLLYVAAPTTATALMQVIYNLTDMFWLGRLSADDVAASGSANMYLWLGMALLIFGRTGAEIGVSQNKGKGDIEAAKAYVQNTILLSLILGCGFCLILLLFGSPLIAFLNIQEQHVATAAISYLKIVGLGVPATYITAVITGTFNGSGQSKVPFYINALGLLLNMLLNPLIIYYSNLGIVGVATVNTLAQFTVAAMMVIAIKKHKQRPFEEIKLLAKPDSYKLKQIIRWSLPISLESGFFTVLSMLVARVIANFGAQAIAVQRVATQIESLSWMVGSGFGSAVTLLWGKTMVRKNGRGLKAVLRLLLLR